MSAPINKPPPRGLLHIVHALGYSMRGLRAALRFEEAFRIELVVAALMLPLAFWIGQGPLEYALLIGALLLVLIVELVNSAIEAVVDRVGVEHHELSGRAKDIGSAAVLLALINASVVWGLLLWQALNH